MKNATLFLLNRSDDVGTIPLVRPQLINKIFCNSAYLINHLKLNYSISVFGFQISLNEDFKIFETLVEIIKNKPQTSLMKEEFIQQEMTESEKKIGYDNLPDERKKEITPKGYGMYRAVFKGKSGGKEL